MRPIVRIQGEEWISAEPPQTVPAPMLFQEWTNVTFVHWPCHPDAVHPHIPEGLRLETFDGRAWLSLISFRIPRMRPIGLPPVPGVSHGTETHLRTYVEASDGRRGIWLLSVEFEPLTGAALARGAFWLPYWWSPHSVEVTPSRIRYAARRRLGPGVMADVSVRPGAAIRETKRDRFLTARWILFLRYGSLVMAAPVEHPRWRLRSVEAAEVTETVTARLGLPPTPNDPVVHFSPGVPAKIGFPRPVSADPGRRT